MTENIQYIADTIVAVATPSGKGGIGVVRVSGPDVEAIAERMLGLLPVARQATVRTFLGADTNPIDSGVALYFPAPASFTGESVLELQGHGGPVVLSMLVDTAVKLGARRALPGEFSQRAFLNGKLDLVQAEAVADLIDSGTQQAARAAHRSLTGQFSATIDALAAELVKLRLHVEAAIDFPEEEIDFLADDRLLAQLEQCATNFQSLTRKVQSGRALRDGLCIAIAGRPNVGKSSLLNCLSGHDSAIVTDIEGTTRDIIREQIDINGLSLEFVDTAGLRDDPGTDDQGTIEAEGIRRTKKTLASADAVLWVQDARDDVSLPPEENIPEGAKIFHVRNKIDLSGDEPGFPRDEPTVVNLSAKTGAGVDTLVQAIQDVVGYEDLGEGAFSARRRHVDALDAAAEHFHAGLKALHETRAGELLAEELKLAHDSLGEITGAVSSDDLLGRIFAEFCIGK